MPHKQNKKKILSVARFESGSLGWMMEALSNSAKLPNSHLVEICLSRNSSSGGKVNQRNPRGLEPAQFTTCIWVNSVSSVSQFCRWYCQPKYHHPFVCSCCWHGYFFQCLARLCGLQILKASILHLFANFRVWGSNLCSNSAQIHAHTLLKFHKTSFLQLIQSLHMPNQTQLCFVLKK